MDRPDPTSQIAILKAQAMEALREGRFDLADALLTRGDVTLAELTHNLRVYQAELEAQAQELRDANQRLESVTSQFRRLFEALPQPALVVDPLGVIVRRNLAAEQLFGIDAESHVKPALRRLAADAAGRYAIHAALAEAHANGRARASSVALLDRQRGEHRADLFLERIAAHGGDEGERQLVLIVDESERIAAAERLAATNLALRTQQRENRTLAAVARSTNAMVVMTDAQRRITWVNRAFEEISGWRSDEVIGRTPRLLQGPGTDEATLARMRMHLERGEGFSGLEVLNYTKAGRPYWLLLDVQPVFSDEGPLEGFVSVQVDVTERRQTEQRLRDAESYQRAVLESAPGLVAAVRADGTVGSLNAAGVELLRLTSSTEAIGRPFSDFVAPADLAAFERVRAASMMGESLTVGVQLIDADGRSLPFELRTGAVWRSGSVQMLVIVGRDVSAERALAAMRAEKEAALAASLAKSRFLSQMSHELRTPLNAVLGFAQLLATDQDIRLGGPQREQVGQILQASEHLLSLINDLLDLSRIETGEIAFHFEPVCLESALRSAAGAVDRLFEQTGVHFSVQGIDGGTCVRADRLRLQQVLINLLSNAAKYNQPGGWVRVAARASRAAGAGAEDVTITVSDSGRGMNASQLEHLFEPFNRLGAETGSIEGTGIGLTITRRLVLGMGGRLDVHSTPGVGSEFSVTLPRCREASEARALPPRAARHVAATRRLRVIYAEDNPVNVMLVQQMSMRQPLVDLEVAESGAAALEAAVRNRPDLMLVDMNLGDMTGIDVCRELQARPETAGVTCVALSADAMPGQVDAAREAGFADYLTKPLKMADLLRLYERALERTHSAPDEGQAE